MGKPVTVDSDDLEALLLAAELGARIQTEVGAITQDVRYRQRQPDMRESITRCNRAFGEATKVRDNPYECEPPDYIEIRQMHEIANYDGGVVRVPDIRPYETLRLKGYAVAGSGGIVVRWGDKTTTAFADNHQFIRLTEKGLTWLAQNGRHPALQTPAPAPTARSLPFSPTSD